MRSLEEEAREPHQAAYEAARAELEEVQLQLQDAIKDMKNAIMCVHDRITSADLRRNLPNTSILPNSEHDHSRKASCSELQRLKAREIELDKEKKISEERVEYVVHSNTLQLHWKRYLLTQSLVQRIHKGISELCAYYVGHGVRFHSWYFVAFKKHPSFRAR